MRAKSLPLLVLLALTACEKNEPKPESTPREADAGAPRSEAIDPESGRSRRGCVGSERARRRARRRRSKVGRRPTACSRPAPPTKSCARGALPKITLGSEGSDPKQQLGPRQAPAKLSGTIQIAHAARSASGRDPGAART